MIQYLIRIFSSESISDHSCNEPSRRSKEDDEMNSSGIEEEQQQKDDENDHSSAGYLQINMITVPIIQDHCR